MTRRAFDVVDPGPPDVIGAEDPFASWYLVPLQRPHAAAQLILVPYAGGGPAAYHDWPGLLGPMVDTWMLRLPGRESRLREPAMTRMRDIVVGAAAAAAGHLREPFAIFGYSVGAWIAFELARELGRAHGLHAAHLTVAARPAPHVPHRHRPMHTLPDDEFVHALDTRFKAIPPAIRQAPETLRLYLPTLRADTTVLETYRYVPSAPMACPITAFGGTDDLDCPEADLLAWGEHTAGGFRHTMMDGGHFFLREHKARLVDELRADLFAALLP